MSSTINTSNPTGTSVSQNGNRLNNAGYLGPVGAGRTASVINVSVAAGATLAFPQAGDNFYFILLTAPIQARPSNGVFNTYQVGTGLRCDEGNYFSILELFNPNAFPVVVSFFVGFGGYIDNRVIIANNGVGNITFGTYTQLSSASFVEVDDLSGTTFPDQNGDEWIAIARNFVTVCNLDVGDVILVMAKTFDPANALYAVQPLTSISLPTSGDLGVTVNNSAPINGYITEIYQAIRKS